MVIGVLETSGDRGLRRFKYDYFEAYSYNYANFVLTYVPMCFKSKFDKSTNTLLQYDYQLRFFFSIKQISNRYSFDLFTRGFLQK